MIHTIGNTLSLIACDPKLESLMQNGYINGIVINGIDIIAYLTNEKDF